MTDALQRQAYCTLDPLRASECVPPEGKGGDGGRGGKPILAILRHSAYCAHSRQKIVRETRQGLKVRRTLDASMTLAICCSSSQSSVFRALYSPPLSLSVCLSPAGDSDLSEKYRRSALIVSTVTVLA